MKKYNFKEFTCTAYKQKDLETAVDSRTQAINWLNNMLEDGRNIEVINITDSENVFLTTTVYYKG